MACPANRGDLPDVKNIFRVTGLAVALATVGLAAPAYAAGSTATTMTLTPNYTSITSGQPLSFLAAITPFSVVGPAGTVKITGTVDFAVVNGHGASVACPVVKPLNPGGKARCTIPKGVLLAADGPFTATATYSGDDTFGGSSATASATASEAGTRVIVSLDTKPPVSGASTTVTVQVSGGAATALLTGNVIFQASSSYHVSSALNCTGTAKTAAANNIKAVSGQQAVCVLPAGWFKVPTPSTTNPKPKGSWSISVTYTGNSSFLPSFKTLQGNVAG